MVRSLCTEYICSVHTRYGWSPISQVRAEEGTGYHLTNLGTWAMDGIQGRTNNDCPSTLVAFQVVGELTYHGDELLIYATARESPEPGFTIIAMQASSWGRTDHSCLPACPGPRVDTYIVDTAYISQHHQR